MLSVVEEFKSGVAAVFDNGFAFAAFMEGGKLVTWGHGEHGGDSRSVAEELRSGVTSVFSGGKLVTWEKEMRWGLTFRWIPLRT